MAIRHPPIAGSAGPEGLRGWHWRAVVGIALVLLGGCASPVAGAPASAKAGMPLNIEGIQEISLERSCFGCAGPSLLVLRRDGSASLTQTGQARAGSEDRVAHGTLRSEDFDRIARLAVAGGFFEMQDVYQEPGLQDGAWSTLRVLRGTQDKRVFRREDAGPAALNEIESAIDALKARISFAPASPPVSR